MNKFEERINILENSMIKMENDLAWIKRMVIATLVLLTGRTVADLTPSAISLMTGGLG